MTTRSSPENHLQLPYFGHLTSTETIQPQSSVTDVLFLPGKVESGFQPMTGGGSEDYPGYESELRRYDGPHSYQHQPRYSPRPIRGPARPRMYDQRHWSSSGDGRNGLRNPVQFYSERNPSPVSYGRRRPSSRPQIRPEYRDSHFYRSQPESFTYEQSDKPEASRHISYYDDDISDIENSILREPIFGEKL